ncbi:hypothetical protein BCP8-2_062 [Bacillus phage BCP8-2]|uniref:Uncharacterized protein n=1 Tax=Bacillus phage BCP8-2 TaxID=1129192 RepID=A0A0E3D9E3_9CAUD|nr:hypothetical protein BCP8-2_062 [Bacillus phage BCP8-2]AHJ87100.1 hypothetical protein BCP8-2_062 [Bacillus phage BCP8-2]
MRKVYKKEWKELIDKAMKENNTTDLSFLWSQYEEIERNGYFSLPF